MLFTHSTHKSTNEIHFAAKETKITVYLADDCPLRF